jgi:type II secretory pathway pseudopilin PulG
MQHRKFAKSQNGFSMIQLMVVIAISLLLAVAASNQYLQKVRDGAAYATGRYLGSVRVGVQDALSKYYSALALIDTSKAPAGTYPNAPAWAKFAGNQTTLNVAQLKQAGLIRADFPNTPPFGRSVHVKIIRSNCPGDGCTIKAYAYTCWAISAARPSGTVDTATCPAQPSGWKTDANLVGQVILGSNGYGGSNVINPARVTGALMDFPASDLDIPTNSPGHAVIAASLDSSNCSECVKQGDTRHIFLNNALSVASQIDTDDGLLINTNVPVNSACTTEGLYGSSNRVSAVMCQSGLWREQNSLMLTSAQSMANGATVVPPSCPGANMQAFAYASLQNLDVTMTGSDVNVRGNMTGSITGSGNTRMNGSVSVSGTYNGTTQSSPDSAIRVTQGVAIVGNRVQISPASITARALVIQGCRYL